MLDSRLDKLFGWIYEAKGLRLATVGPRELSSTDEDIVQVIKDSLPKKSRVNPENIARDVATYGGFLLAVGALFAGNIEIREILSVSSICILFLVLFLYTYARDRQGLHRYSQAVSHLHFAAHVTRDALAKNTEAARESAVRDLVTSCSTIFSIVTGKNCYVTVKHLRNESDGTRSLINIESDYISKTRYDGLNKVGHNKKSKYRLTDPELYYSVRALTIGESSRCYISNDTYADWISNRYSHPALFNEDGARLILTNSIFGLLIPDWPLAFRSTIVAPIRFAAISNTRTAKTFDYFGFLCIDCGSRNVFDNRYAPDLAGAYADLLYLLRDQSNKLADRLGSPPGIEMSSGKMEP